jgi:hypothetical protein
LNNGTCVENMASLNFTCECGENFEGVYCETKHDACKNETCSSNGVCYDENSQVKCKCFSLYSGEKCEIESSERKQIKTIISSSSILAIILLALFYLIIIFLDINRLFRYLFGKKKRIARANYTKEGKITKLVYHN